MSDELEVVRRLFRAVEALDLAQLLDCYHPDIEIHEAPTCPTAGRTAGSLAPAGTPSPSPAHGRPTSQPGRSWSRGSWTPARGPWSYCSATALEMA